MKYRLGSLTDIDRICGLVSSAIRLMDSQGIYQWDEIYPTKEDFMDVFSENPFALKLYKRNGYQVRGCADWRKGRFFLMEKSLLPEKKNKTEENG